jgi:phosphohistidine phosphatase
MPDTKRLLLLRHAKSSWDDPALADHDRPLAPRGRKAAKRIGEHVRRNDIPIDLVLCSSARRARETLELVGPSAEIQVEPGLYGASADELLERLRRVPEEVETVMLIGHNPAIQELTIDLAAHAGELAHEKYPTGALATLTFIGPWHALDPGRAELTAFVRPRELGSGQDPAPSP